MIRRVRTKRGLTLVELLVVVGVASVIAAVMLPGIKSVLTDRKSSQAAIMVRNYIEAARTRAVGRKIGGGGIRKTFIQGGHRTEWNVCFGVGTSWPLGHLSDSGYQLYSVQRMRSHESGRRATSGKRSDVACGSNV